MTDRQPPDIQARLSALNPAESFIVQAPAGSGKTSLLTDRILRLLAYVERPEQIVAMTFTRKAAAEMHSRVMEKLHLASHDEPPTDPHERQSWAFAREALARDAALSWGLLAHPARLRIQTIDSFCASLVRSMPWLTGLGGMPRIVEHAPGLYELAAREILAAADQFACVRELLVHLDLNVQLAAEALSDMLGKRDQWLPLVDYVDELDVLQGHWHATLIEELGELDKRMPLGWQEELAKVGRLAAQVLCDEGKPDHPIARLLDWRAGEIQVDLDVIPLWQAVADLLLTGEGQPRKRLDKRMGCPGKSEQKDLLEAWLGREVVGDPLPGWVAGLHAIRAMPDPYLTEAQWRILQAQLQCLKLVAAQLAVIFAQRGEVDFIEISQRAVQALGQEDDPSDLLLKLDNRIEHLLVDEFQDTSAIQIGLLERLTSGWQPGDGRTLFLVGDPMQSIYRFRKAEVGLFLDVQARGIGSVQLTPLTLTANFRSQGGVVQWVNQTFKSIFPADNHAEFGAIRYEMAHAWHPTSEQPAVNWHIEPTASQTWDRAVDIVKDAWVRHLQSDKPVAVLVRSRSHLGEVARRLGVAGLPCRAVELDRLQTRGVVVDLLELTRALVHRGDRAAWLGVLRAPWCGLTLGTLLTLFGDAREPVCDVLASLLKSGQCPTAMDADQWARLKGVGTILLAALQADDALPLVARVETVWRQLEGDRLARDVADLADAQAFFELIERLADFSYLDMDEVERQLPLLYAQPQAGGRAVEIMTMHKAKGLEFETVVLLALERQPASDKAPLVRVEQVKGRVLFGPVKPRIQKLQDPLSNYLAQRESLRFEHEVDRLLYVAATRARQDLHLVACLAVNEKTGDWKEPVKGSLLSRLWSYRPELRLPEPDAPDAIGNDSAKPFWEAPDLRRRQDPLIANVAEVSLAEMGTDRYRWPDAESAERITGILIHAWLAQLASQDTEPAQVKLDDAVLRRQLRALGLPEPLRNQAVVEVATAVTAMLSSERGRWLLSQPLRKVEWALIDARQTVSILDLAIDLPSGWLVVDYKNTHMLPGEMELEFANRMKGRYGGQMQRYREQLSQLDGRPVRTVLYFPRDDRWIEVCD